MDQAVMLSVPHVQVDDEGQGDHHRHAPEEAVLAAGTDALEQAPESGRSEGARPFPLLCGGAVTGTADDQGVGKPLLKGFSHPRTGWA
jgi:hypothetical protein